MPLQPDYYLRQVRQFWLNTKNDDMKKIYLAFIPFILLFLIACKKDKPEAYDTLLTSSTWELYDYYAPNYINPSFVDGTINFFPGGRVEYIDKSGNTYNGTWDHVWHGDLETHGLLIDAKD